VKTVVLFLGIIILLLSLTFVQAANYPAPLVQAGNIQSNLQSQLGGGSITPDTVVGDSTLLERAGVIKLDEEESYESIDCKKHGCWYENNCYAIGERINSYLKYNKDFSWRYTTYFYCGEKSKLVTTRQIQFIPQKTTKENCENHYECLSGFCLNNLCTQEEGITLTPHYTEDNLTILSISLKEEETFYFNGELNNYSIGFGKNDTSFFLFVNNKSSSDENKILKLDDNIYFIFNSISFEDSKATANITFIESKNPIGDPKELLNKLSPKEEKMIELKEQLNETPSLGQITGKAVETQKGSLFDKIINFFKNLFS
jgi:hypothetical protein